MTAATAALRDTETMLLQRDGHARVDDDRVIDRLGAAAVDWRSFAAGWADLPLDTFMGDGGRYRRRRFATFDVADGTVRAKPPQPHFQASRHNHLNGGIDRHFAPIADAAATHPTFIALVHWCADVFAALSPAVRAPRWHMEAHQFRIEAALGAAALPTPEGLHRDGVDWGFVLLLARHNVTGGVTTITGPDRRAIDRFTLTRPLEGHFLDDSRVFHEVSPIAATDPTQPAIRDVLVLTFRDVDRPAGAWGEPSADVAAA